LFSSPQVLSIEVKRIVLPNPLYLNDKIYQINKGIVSLLERDRANSKGFPFDVTHKFSLASYMKVVLI
jgi:hypothetical protein